MRRVIFILLLSLLIYSDYDYMNLEHRFVKAD